MAWAYINSSATTAASSSTPTYTIPSGLAAGHLIVFVFVIDENSATISAGPSGYTSILSSTSGTSFPRTQVYYKFSDGTETTIQTTLSASAPTNGGIMLYAGIGAFDAVSAVATGTSTTATTSTLSSLGINDLLINCFLALKGTATTLTAGSGYTQRAKYDSTLASEAAMLLGDEIVSSTSAARSATLSVSNGWKAFQLAFKANTSNNSLFFGSNF